MAKIEAEFVEPVYPWVPDRGDGTYRNPVLCADYSDPDVIRVGEDFWLTASSFTDTPGLPILHSRDLVNWAIVNHAIRAVPGDKYKAPLPGCGVWAPAIRYHDRKFWIFFPTPDEGVYVTTADDPRGEWAEPWMLLAGKGIIDPCPLWDDDGRAYLVHAYAGSRAGIKNRLQVRPMSPDGRKMLGEGQVVFHEPQRHPTLEGPKFYKKDGWYYLSAPAGGVPTGWQLILRSRNIWGPYEQKIVLAQGSTPVNGPHQGALVDAPDGRWWFVHFQERLPFGRIVHLQPVRWEDGWPLIGARPAVAITDATLAPVYVKHYGPVGPFTDAELKDVGVPVGGWEKPVAGMKVEVPATGDEFDGERLGLQWQWHANFEDGWWSLKDRAGWLRLNAVKVDEGDFQKAPNLLLQKLPAVAFAVESKVELKAKADGVRGGVIVMGMEYAAMYLEQKGEEVGLFYSLNGKAELLTHVSEDAAEFRLVMDKDGSTRFSYRADEGPWMDAPPAFKAREGRWIGAKVGVFCLDAGTGTGGGYADVDYFRFSAV